MKTPELITYSPDKKAISNQNIEIIKERAKNYADCQKNAEQELYLLNAELEKGERNQELIDSVSRLADLLNKTEKVINEDLNGLFEKSKKMVNEKDLFITTDCSLVDILFNSPLIDAACVVKMASGAVKDRGKISKLNSAIDRLDITIDKILFYITTLCSNEDILIDELSKRSGYLDRFRGYFKDCQNEASDKKIFPTGAKKIDFFALFQNLSQGKFDPDELKKAQEELPKGYLKEDLQVMPKVR